jgi:hypothetical protein
MTRTKKWVTGIVGGVSAIYKVTENMVFMKPAVAWLDQKIGHDTFIELLLSTLVVYLLFSHEEKEATATEPANKRMSNESPLSREQQIQFLDKLKEPLNEAEEQKRRSVEVSAGFFEKIAALSAGSTAVLASLILAIANKSDIHTGWAQIVVHHLLLIASALGASLILAVLHNLLAALHARADANIAESQLDRKIITLLPQFVHDGTTPQVLAQAEDMVLRQMSPRANRQVAWRDSCYVVATWAGGLSMTAFVGAFLLVIIYLWQLW